MRKIITLLLVFVLSFSLFASCKKKQDSTPESTGTPQTSESISESTSESEPESIPSGSTTGAMLASALSSQIKSAKSIRVDYSVYERSDLIAYYYATDNEENLLSEVVVEDNFYENERIVSAILSVDENGKLDANIRIMDKYSFDREEPIENFAYPYETVYIIDNNVYAWSDIAEAWVVNLSASKEIEQIVEVVISLQNGELISAEDEAKLFAVFGDFVNTSFSVKDYKGSISIDGKPHFDALLNYFKNLDLETKTMASLIDDGLKLIDNELTSQIVLAKVKEVANLTVEQAVARIDAWLTQNYQTTLQGVYDKFVESDLIVDFIADTSGVPAEERENVIAIIKDAKIAEMIAEVKDLSVYDLIMGVLGGGLEYPLIDELFVQIEGMFALSVAEFEQQVLPMPIFSIISEGVKYTTINRMDATMDIQFTDIFSIDSIQGEIHVDVVNESPSEVEDKTNYNKTNYDVVVKISEISESITPIAIPSEDRVLEFFANGNYENRGEGLSNLWVDVYGDELIFELSGELPSGLYVSYMATLPIEAAESSRIEVAPEDIEVYVDGNTYVTTLDKSIIVQIYEDYFVIEQAPDLGFADLSAYKAVLSISDGENDYYVDPNLGITIELWVGSMVGQIYFEDTYPISLINFEMYNDYKTGELVCTISGYHTDGYLINVETGTGYIGSIPDQIPVIFGGDIEFTFYVTPDGMVTCDDMPEVLPQYIE